MTLTNEEALKALKKIEPVLEAHLGIGIFVSEEIRPIPRLSTGLAVVDYILGGGIPIGLITEVYGPEGTGKTTFATQVAAHNQRLNPNFRVLMLDFEQTFVPEYAVKGLGLDYTRPRFIHSQPSTLEEGGIVARTLITHGLVDLVIWDTPAASQPAAIINTPVTPAAILKAQREIEAGKSSTGAIGLHARIFTQELASLIPHLNKHSVTLLVPNQLRTTINAWGAGETTPGGRALKFNASVRIRLSKKETTKESVADQFLGTKGQQAIGQTVQFRTVKNKTAPQEKLVDVDLQYGRGFLDKETLLDLAVKRGIVKKSAGGNFEAPGGHRVRGTDNLLGYWRENPDQYQVVIDALYATPLEKAEDLTTAEPAPRSLEPDVDEIYEDDETADVPEGKVAI